MNYYYTYRAKCAKVNKTRRAEPYVTKGVSTTDRDEQVEGEGGTEGAEKLQCGKSR